MSDDRDAILIRVARCVAGDPPAAPAPSCSAIVAAQATDSISEFQVPEPWRGDIVNARLLFISSNPALNPDDDCPTASATNDDIKDYYNHRGFPPEFPRNRLRGGRVGRPVNFWSQLRERAAECYRVDTRLIVPGQSFALTEVVHCKSNKGRGVAKAAPECIGRHFGGIMHLSSANVVVILGSKAARALDVPKKRAVTQRRMGDRERILAWLPHPASFEERTFETYSQPDMDRILQALS